MNNQHYEDMPFCPICQHHVQDMARHFQSDDHKRQAGRQSDRETGPRVPGQSRAGNDVAPFPGRLRLGRHRE